jgi:hypothetical protein
MTAAKRKELKVRLIGGLLKIVNKAGDVVPFVFNRMQRHFHLNKSNRNIILKHRQGGMSSSILGDEYTDCFMFDNTSCVVVSHEGRATQRLLDRVHFYHDSMEDPKPIVDAYSRNEISFPETHSSMYIGTAGARAFGRGDTIRKALLSELAYYEDGERILIAVEDAVPMQGELDIECTPNGEDNIFYDRWVAATEGKSPYKPFFYPWWWSDDYRIPRGSEYALPEDIGVLTYTREEEDVIEAARKNGFVLCEDQIRWRRWKIAEKGGMFWQEFPEDAVSCFIAIGDPVFDQYLLSDMASKCYEGSHHPDGWEFWIPPDSTGVTHYVIGADSSAGAPTGSYSAAVVLDDYWNVCATFQARVEPGTFASVLKKMGIWYNNAQIAIERNFTGFAVLGSLVGGHTLDNPELKLGNYPNIYRQRDFLTGKVSSNLGWWTNEQTSEHMRTSLRERLPMLKMWNINLVRQLRGYRFIKMKPTAQTFNDMAIALMIAVAIKRMEGGSRGYVGAIPGWSW